VILGDREAAGQISGELVAVANDALNVFDLTCLARHLGGASALLGRFDEARSYYNQALEICTRIGFRPEIALTRLALAELLLDWYPHEYATAAGHLDFAIAELRHMNMRPALDRALRQRSTLAS
jgi:tetratricopeptide (TPR) repeat protein